MLCQIRPCKRETESSEGKKSCKPWHAMRCCRPSSRVQVFLSREEDDVDRYETLQEGDKGKK